MCFLCEKVLCYKSKNIAASLVGCYNRSSTWEKCYIVVSSLRLPRLCVCGYLVVPALEGGPNLGKVSLTPLPGLLSSSLEALR